MDPSPRDSAVVLSILPMLADQCAIDWAKPLANWSREEMAGFIELADRLINEARAALDRGPGAILHKPERELGDEIPFEVARYVLTLVPLPAASPIRGLRAIVKNALRAHGMRCTASGSSQRSPLGSRSRRAALKTAGSDSTHQARPVVQGGAASRADQNAGSQPRNPVDKAAQSAHQ
jgi:hypothetical protein